METRMSQDPLFSLLGLPHPLSALQAVPGFWEFFEEFRDREIQAVTEAAEYVIHGLEVDERLFREAAGKHPGKGLDAKADEASRQMKEVPKGAGRWIAFYGSEAFANAVFQSWCKDQAKKADRALSEMLDNLKRLEVEKVSLESENEGLRARVEDHEAVGEAVVTRLVAQGYLPRHPTDGLPGDGSVWVPASKLCPDKNVRLTKAASFCRRYKIRTNKPHRNRLEIHAGDWARYWAQQDKAGFEGLDSGGENPSVSENADLVVEGAAERLKAIQARRQRQQGGK